MHVFLTYIKTYYIYITNLRILSVINTCSPKGSE